MVNYKIMKEYYKQLINEYLNSKRINYTRYNKKVLPALDKSSDKYYTGVTLPYIAKYVCETNDLSIISQVLIEMFSSNQIRCLYCCDINNIVFESAKYKTNHGTIIKEYNQITESKNSYDYLIKYLKSYNENLNLSYVERVNN